MDMSFFSSGGELDFAELFRISEGFVRGAVRVADVLDIVGTHAIELSTGRWTPEAEAELDLIANGMTAIVSRGVSRVRARRVQSVHSARSLADSRRRAGDGTRGSRIAPNAVRAVASTASPWGSPCVSPCLPL
jgi:hypothetical protein